MAIQMTQLRGYQQSNYLKNGPILWPLVEKYNEYSYTHVWVFI